MADEREKIPLEEMLRVMRVEAYLLEDMQESLVKCGLRSAPEAGQMYKARVFRRIGEMIEIMLLDEKAFRDLARRIKREHGR